MAGVVLFLAVVIALHALQRGYDPANQLMSELALGPHGGAMLLAFAGLAISAFAINVAIRADAAMPLRASLIASAVSFLTAGIFPLGETSTLHIAAIAVAFVLAVLAMYLFPTMAGAASAAAPRAFSWTMAAGVAASVALGHSVLPMGVGQRAAAGFLALWFLVAGWRLARREG